MEGLGLGVSAFVCDAVFVNRSVNRFDLIDCLPRSSPDYEGLGTSLSEGTDEGMSGDLVLGLGLCGSYQLCSYCCTLQMLERWLGGSFGQDRRKKKEREERLYVR